MTVESIEQDFRDKVSAQIRLAAEGVDRFRVFTPFLFDDGDHLAKGEYGVGALGRGPYVHAPHVRH